jgi:WD40 repeat protein
MLHDAFISYSRKDAVFARALERALERYWPPKTLDVPSRRLVIFRDEDDFTGTEYHQSLDRHLQNSDKLIVLCSPSARASAYVNDEIRQFARLRGADHVVPVLVSGLPNNEAGPGDDALKAYPDALCDIMAMPLAADYRGFLPGTSKIRSGAYQGPWYTILANLYGRSRSEVEQRDLKYRQRQRRIVVGTVGAIAVVLLSLAVAAWMQRREAVRQLAIATAQELSSRAADLRQDDPGRNLRVGVLLAAESLRTAWTEQGYTLWRSFSGRMPKVVAEAPTDSVSLDLAFTPDGKKLVVLCGERHVHVLSVPDLKELHVLEADQTAYNIALNHAGDRVAAYQRSGSIQVFDIHNGGSAVNIFAELKQVAFDASGRVVVLSEGEVSVHDPTTGKSERTFPIPAEPIDAVLSGDGSLVAILTTKALTVLNVSDGSVRWTVGQPAQGAFGRAIFSGDSRHVLAIAPTAVSISEAATGATLRSEPIVGAESRLPARVFTGGDIYNVESTVYRISRPGAISMEFASDTSNQLPRDPMVSLAGEYIAGLDGQSRPEYAVFDADDLARPRSLQFTLDRGQTTRRVAFDAAGRRLAVATFERGVPGSKLPSGVQLVSLERASWPATAATSRLVSLKNEFDVSRSGDLVVVTDRPTGETVGYAGDGTRLWSSNETGQLGPGPGIVLSPRGDRLARHSAAKGWVITDLASKSSRVIQSHGPLVFSPDEKRVLIASRIYALDQPDVPVAVPGGAYFNRLWSRPGANHVVAEQVADGVVRGFALFDWRSSSISSLVTATNYAIDDGGSRLAAITDGALEIRKLDDLAKPIASTKINPQIVLDDSMHFSPDGKFLTVGVPLAARIYDATTLEKRFEIPMLSDERIGGFSRDGAFLVTYYWRDVFPQPILNPLTVEGVLAETCSKVRRPLTPEEWRQFSPKTAPHDTCP